jgi:hypothetical protein
MCVSCSSDALTISDIHNDYDTEYEVSNSKNINNCIGVSQYTFSITEDGVSARCNNDSREFYVCSYSDRFIFLNGTIFFALQDGLYSLNGNEKYRLVVGQIRSFADADGWICFASSDGIFKIRYDGTELTQITMQSTSTLTVIGYYIYYIIEDQDSSKESVGEDFYTVGQLARIDMHGEDFIDYKISVINLASYDGVLYFVGELANTIYTMNIMSGEINTLSEGLAFVDTMDFYSSSSENWLIAVDFRDIIKISLADGTVKSIRKGGWNYILCIYDGYIYFTDSLLIDTNTGDYGLRKMQIDSA